MSLPSPRPPRRASLSVRTGTPSAVEERRVRGRRRRRSPSEGRAPCARSPRPSSRRGLRSPDAPRSAGPRSRRGRAPRSPRPAGADSWVRARERGPRRRGSRSRPGLAGSGAGAFASESGGSGRREASRGRGGRGDRGGSDGFTGSGGRAGSAGGGGDGSDMLFVSSRDVRASCHAFWPSKPRRERRRRRAPGPDAAWGFLASSPSGPFLDLVSSNISLVLQYPPGGGNPPGKQCCKECLEKKAWRG